MSAKLSPPRLFVPDKDEPLLDQMRQIHADCILQDGQLATFLPPLDLHRMRQYWKDKCDQVQLGEIAIIIQLEATRSEEPRVAGYVCLGLPFAETGPFRGIVTNFFVSTKFRRVGVGRALMTKLEEVAREKGRYLLVLDTTIGTAADSVYPRLGFKEFGVIQRYGISPLDGRLVDERFYYKDLRETAWRYVEFEE